MGLRIISGNYGTLNGFHMQRAMQVPQDLDLATTRFNQSSPVHSSLTSPIAIQTGSSQAEMILSPMGMPEMPIGHPLLATVQSSRWATRPHLTRRHPGCPPQVTWFENKLLCGFRKKRVKMHTECTERAKAHSSSGQNKWCKNKSHCHQAHVTGTMSQLSLALCPIWVPRFSAPDNVQKTQRLKTK